MVSLLSRKEFLKGALALVGTGVVLDACSSDAATGPQDSGAPPDGGNTSKDAGQTQDAATAQDTGATQDAGTTQDAGAAQDTGTKETASGGACTANGAKDQNLDDPEHRLVVSSADVVAGVAKSYSIRGTSPHDHTVTLTAADFAKLKADTKITVTSSTDDGHDHTFDVVCA